MRIARGSASVVALLLPALLLVAPNAIAQPALEVVAEGLDNPRGISVAPDGSLYVAEAGVGGRDACQMATSPEEPEPLPFEVCVGATGAVTRIKDGGQQRVVTGLPSSAEEGGFAAGGPQDVTTRGLGQLHVSIGLGGTPDLRAGFGPAGALTGQVVVVSRKGVVRALADLAAYEAEEDPNGEGADSNPYGLFDQFGLRYAVDAGGNSLLRYFPDGTIQTVATFPTQPAPFPFPDGPPEVDMQSVPTAVTRGPDGYLYVSELTGFPFTVGLARVWRVPPFGGQPQVVHSGFTNIIDIAFDRQGNLYVLELVKGGLLTAEGPESDLTGQLIRVATDGTREVVASEGLVAPGSVAVGHDGALYVSNFSIFPDVGQVVRINP